MKNIFIVRIAIDNDWFLKNRLGKKSQIDQGENKINEAKTNLLCVAAGWTRP